MGRWSRAVFVAVRVVSLCRRYTRAGCASPQASRVGPVGFFLMSENFCSRCTFRPRQCCEEKVCGTVTGRRDETAEGEEDTEAGVQNGRGVSVAQVVRMQAASAGGGVSTQLR